MSVVEVVTPTQQQRQIPCAAASRCAISRNWRRRRSETPCDWLPSAGGGGGGGGTERAEREGEAETIGRTRCGPPVSCTSCCCA